MPYKTILAPQDGSKKSDDAFRCAVELIRQMKGSPELILLNVVETIELPPLVHGTRSHISGEVVGPEQLRKEWYQSMKARAKEMLSVKEKEASQAGIKVRTVVKYGYPEDEIVRFAREERVDLIVIGNVGLRGLSKLRVLGSVSRSVTEKSECPVLMVH